MKILKFLDKLFDLTSHVESTLETVSKKTRKTVEKTVSAIMRSIQNSFIYVLSFLLVLTGLILVLAKYAPLEYVLLFVGLLGFLYLAVQKVSIRIK